MADRFTLPRIRVANPITDKAGMAVAAFVRFWDTVCRQIEAQEAQQTATLEQLQTVQAEQGEILDRLIRAMISTSHTDSLTIIAEADGDTAKVTISDHTRVYVDGEVAVTGGVRTALEYGTQYAFYYDDEERAGGAVDFLATTAPSQAVTSAANPYRHFMGVVQTPATSGDSPTGGGGSIPPGFPPGGDYEYVLP